MAKQNITWAGIVSQLNTLRSEVDEQHFWIDASYRLFRMLKNNTEHRSDLNLQAISTYWGKHILDHYILNEFKMDAKRVLFDLEYYSYLDISDLLDIDLTLGRTTYIVDLITDSTDVKEGEELEAWMDENTFFKETLKTLWNDQMLEIWQKEDKLKTRKKGNIKLDSYWNYEDYLLILKVYDENLDTMVMFLLGTYADYMDN